MASAEIPRSATNPPRHLGYMAEFWEEVPPYIRDRLLRVSLDDACGYAAQARTSADNEAQAKHARTTAELRRQREDVTAATVQTKHDFAEIAKEFNLRLASLDKKTQANRQRNPVG